VALGDIKTPMTPGWWMIRLSLKRTDPERAKRFDQLEAYLAGNPPLPVEREQCQAAFALFQESCRVNLAEPTVLSLTNRMRPIGIRTGADDDEAGDIDAWKVITRAGMKVVFRDTHERMCGLSEGLVWVGDVNPETGVPLVTAEDPRECVAEEDPATGSTLAAHKAWHDSVQGKDFAVLVLRGDPHVDSEGDDPSVQGLGLPPSGPDTRLLVAWHECSRLDDHAPYVNQDWTWDTKRSAPIPKLGGMVPVVRFVNRRGVAEFEPHTDLLDRLNRMIMNQMVIATYQAFQRLAATGLPQRYPEDHPVEELRGEIIDYEKIFTSDPGGIFALPKDSLLQVIPQVDMTGILSAIKDAQQQFSAATMTPMYVFSPDSANQTAEGASLSREGQVGKADDRIDRVDPRWAKVISLCFRWMGDEQRADLASLELMWDDTDKASMIEKSQAAAQAGSIPQIGIWRNIWKFSPAEIDRLSQEQQQQELKQQAQQLSMMKQQAALAPKPAPGSPSSGGSSGKPAPSGGRSNGGNKAPQAARGGKSGGSGSAG
jgi:hypothetical protein